MGDGIEWKDIFAIGWKTILRIALISIVVGAWKTVRDAAEWMFRGMFLGAGAVTGALVVLRLVGVLHD